MTCQICKKAPATIKGPVRVPDDSEGHRLVTVARCAACDTAAPKIPAPRLGMTPAEIDAAHAAAVARSEYWGQADPFTPTEPDEGDDE